MEINEFALGDFVFGGNRPPGTNDIFVTNFQYGGKPDGTYGDATRPGEDGTSFGFDTLNGSLLTFEGVVNGNSATGRDRFNELQGLWTDESSRRVAEAVQPLRFYLQGSIPLRVYGRPRAFNGNDLNFLRMGKVPWTATFQAADHRYYSDQAETLTLSMVPPENLPANPLNVNPGFETDVSSWTATGGTLASTSAYAHTGTKAALMTPDGATSSVYVRSEAVSAEADVRYHAGIWARSSTGTVNLRVGIDWLDESDAPLSSSTGDTVSVGTAWTKLKVVALAPAGSATARIRLAYTDATPTSLVYLDDGEIVELPGFMFPLQFPLQLSGTGRRAEKASNAGNLSSWPVITINGPVSNPTIAYAQKSKKLTVNTRLAVGQSLTIDTHPWARTVLRNDGASLAGSLSGSRLAEMALPPGDTVVSYRGQDLTGLSSASFTYRSAYAAP